MRHLVYLLLVANLAYLGWNLYESRSPSPEVQVTRLPPIPAMASPLVTLQEREAESNRVEEGSGSEITVPDSVEEVSSIEEPSEEQAPVSVLASSQIIPLVPPPQVPPQVSPQEREDDTNQVEQGLGNEITVPDGVEEVSSIEELTEEQPPSAGAVTLCQALGPFLALEDLQAAESRLVDYGLQPVQRELQSKKLTGYWVYLSAMSPEEVKTVVATLKKHHDKEYYVGKTNFISLGTFKAITRAKRRMQEARDLGLDPILQERYTSQASWWLDIQSDGSAAELLDTITEGRPDLQLVELACF
jgi:hypothetical protein